MSVIYAGVKNIAKFLDFCAKDTQKPQAVVFDLIGCHEMWSVAMSRHKC